MLFAARPDRSMSTNRLVYDIRDIGTLETSGETSSLVRGDSPEGRRDGPATKLSRGTLARDGRIGWREGSVVSIGVSSRHDHHLLERPSEQVQIIRQGQRQR